VGILEKFTRKKEAVDTSETTVVSTGQPPATAAPSAPGQEGFFARVRQGLQKTSRLLNTDVRDLFKHEGQLVDDEFLEKLYALLIRTDMGTGPAQEIRDQIQNQFRGRVTRMDDLLVQVKKVLLQLIDQDRRPIELAAAGPTVIVVVGVNGSGKTTTIAKLAQLFLAEGKKVVLGAADTFRGLTPRALEIGKFAFHRATFGFLVQCHFECEALRCLQAH
jgi:fused signal recognition particle receptor